jgi:hypothetical protein
MSPVPPRDLFTSGVPEQQGSDKIEPSTDTRPVRRLRRAVALCIALTMVVGTVIACAPANERPDLARALDSAVANAGDGGMVDLGVVLPLDWDTIYGFPGYTSDAEITAATGADFGTSDDSRIEKDGLNLAVLIHEGEIAAWFILNGWGNTVAVRFGERLYGLPIGRDEAVFTTITREKTTGGFDLYYLMPSS